MDEDTYHATSHKYPPLININIQESLSSSSSRRSAQYIYVDTALGTVLLMLNAFTKLMGNTTTKEEEKRGGGGVASTHNNISHAAPFNLGHGEADSGRRRSEVAAKCLHDGIGLSDFMLLKTVGKGSFGKVYQVKKKDTGQIYAMKVLNKERVIARKQYEHTLSERRILEEMDHPFLVSLRYAFQSGR